MNNAYSITHDGTYVATECTLTMRPNHPYMHKILKLEDALEILKSIRDEKSKRLESLKAESPLFYKVMTFLVPTFFTGFDIVIPPVCKWFMELPIKMIESPLGTMLNVTYDSITLGTLVIPIAAFSLFYCRNKRIKLEKEIAGLEHEVAYLDAEIESVSKSLENFKRRSDSVVTYVANEIHSLEKYNERYRSKLQRILELINYLSSIRKTLTEAQEDKMYAKLMSKGYTPEEIGQAKTKIEISKTLNMEVQNNRDYDKSSDFK